MNAEHWVCVAIAVIVCVPVAIIHSIRLVKAFPKMRDPKVPTVQRIDAQNIAFGALVGIPLPIYGVVVTLWLAWLRLTG